MYYLERHTHTVNEHWRKFWTCSFSTSTRQNLFFLVVSCEVRGSCSRYFSNFDSCHVGNFLFLQYFFSAPKFLILISETTTTTVCHRQLAARNYLLDTFCSFLFFLNLFPLILRHTTWVALQNLVFSTIFVLKVFFIYL